MTEGPQELGREDLDRRRALSRRALITGAAGLVVGAGAVGAVDRLGHPGEDMDARRAPSPGEELMTEHGLLTRLLVAYRTAADRLAAPGAVPLAAVSDAAGVIRDYVESYHEGLEEAYVFPHVRHDHPDLVRTLLVQHDRGRHLTASIAAAGDLDLNDPAARESLRSQLLQFATMYEPHESREDTVIYPALRDALSQRQLDLLAEQFVDLERQQYGGSALAQFLDRVMTIETQLGIDDLATFTLPPLGGAAVG